MTGGAYAGRNGFPGFWTSSTTLKGIKPGQQGSAVWPTPRACCKSTDAECPAEFKKVMEYFEYKFTGAIGDKINGCTDGAKVETEGENKGRCPPGKSKSFDTPTGMQVFAEGVTSIF
jgi:hypothetical protein